MTIATHAADLSTDVRLDTFEGRQYVVAPVVAVQEGVLKGSLLPEQEIEAAAAAFNGVPLPVGHPQDESGDYVTANTPDRIESEVVGRFFNATADTGKLKGETFVDVQKSVTLADTAPRYGAPLALYAQHLSDDDRDQLGDALDALPDAVEDLVADANDRQANAEGPLLEVSTAYFFTPEETSGTFNGTEYDGVQRNLRPDHLALLPHEKGECSVADGCGAPRTNDADSSATDSDSDADQVTADPPTGLAALSRAKDALSRRLGIDHESHAQSDDCGCSHDHETMNNAELAEATGLSEDAIEAMSDDDLEAVQSLIDPNATGDGSSDGDDDPDADAQNSGTDDDLAELRDELNEVKEALASQEQSEREDAIEQLTAHGIDEEHLDDVPTAVLTEMADDLAENVPTANAQAADFSGQMGMAAAQTQGSGDEDAARDLVAALSGKDTDD